MAINEDVFVFGEFSYLTDDVDLTNLVAGGLTDLLSIDSLE